MKAEPTADPREQYNEQRLSEYREHLKRRGKSVAKKEFKKILAEKIRKERENA